MFSALVALTAGLCQDARLATERGWLEQLHPLQGHTFIVNSISFSPTGKLLATASLDQTVRLWTLGAEGQFLVR